MTNTRDEALKLLVIGSSGQVARSLMACQSHYPHLRIAALGRPELDMSDSDSIDRAVAAMSPAIVINAAAYTAVDRAELEPGAAFAVNDAGAGAIAAVTAARGIPLIHISTDYVFDGTKPGPYLETDSPNPLGAYGRSKRQGELRVAAANPRHLIVRTAWVYSPYGSNFLKTMLRLAGERPELRVVADQQGNPTHAGDLAKAMLDVVPRLARADPDAAFWGIYHLTGQGDTSWHGFAERIVAQSVRFGRSAIPVRAIATAEFPTPAPRPANSRLDCSKFAAAFGSMLPPWTAGVDRCVAALCEASSAQSIRNETAETINQTK